VEWVDRIAQLRRGAVTLHDVARFANVSTAMRALSLVWAVITLCWVPATALASKTQPSSAPARAALELPDGSWRLLWNSNRGGDWDVIQQDAEGSEHSLTAAHSNQWVWSTRGTQLVLLSNARDEHEDKGWRASHMRSIESAPQRLAVEPVADGFVDCHPSGSPCLAEVRRDGRKRIAVLRSGQIQSLLDTGKGNAADPQYSPDGEQLLYRSDRSGSWELWLAQADGSAPHVLTSDPENDAVNAHEYGGEGPARFAPDGRSIVWMRKFPQREYDVWTLQLDARSPGAKPKPRNLTADSLAGDGYPSYSPDGRLIAFDSDRTGDSEIFVMSADGSDVRRVSFSKGADLAPVWVRLAVATEH
jgi:Tol biopolymer transport system component